MKKKKSVLRKMAEVSEKNKTFKNIILLGFSVTSPFQQEN